VLHNFDAELAYKSEISVLFSGKALEHSVKKWSAQKDRLVIAHCVTDDV
jgi:hypothetical protein